MGCVIVTRQQNHTKVDDMKMDKKDVKYVRSLFTMMDYFVPVVICGYVNPHDIQNLRKKLYLLLDCNYAYLFHLQNNS